MGPNDPLIDWLNDAYVMEQSITQVLENHAGDAEDLPQFQSRIQQHLDETRRHAELVKGCIERLGGSTSAVKRGIATVMGTLQGMSTGLARDDLVRNALQDYGTEHVEIACYKALVAAAHEIGDQETVAVCRQILRDEEAMAAWLDQNLPGLVIDTFRAMTTPAPTIAGEVAETGPVA